VFVSIIMLLGQQDLMQTVPLVCKSWHAASSEAMQRISLNLSAPERQQHLPYMFTWLQQHGNQLKQLQLSSSTPLGHAAKRALLRSLCTAGRCTERWGHGYSSSPTDTADSRCSPYLSSSSNAPGCGLQLQRLVLQMDLDVADLAYLAFHVVDQAPHLHTLKLEPLKPSLADLQLLVLACIVGNLVGADAPGGHTVCTLGSACPFVAAHDYSIVVCCSHNNRGDSHCCRAGASSGYRMLPSSLTTYQQIRTAQEYSIVDVSRAFCLYVAAWSCQNFMMCY